MKRIQSAAIIGMGALGILYGHLLSAGGACSLQFVMDAGRKARYEKNGVFCNGKRCDFDMRLPAEAVCPDLLIFATKYAGLPGALELARQIAGPGTIVISLMNGITSEEMIEEKLGTGTVLYAVAQGMDATREGSSLNYAHAGTVFVGCPSDEPLKLPALEALCEFFLRSGVPFVRDEDILHRLWVKWMLNVGVNQVCMVKAGGYGIVQKPGEARRLMQEAMGEALLVARASGVNVTQADLQEYVRLIDGLAPDGMPSMRQDGLARRPSEVELFSGTVLRKAHQLNISVPVNEWLYKEIKKIEAGYRQKA